MKSDEIKVRRAAKIVAGVQPTPINPGFISITELLGRLQTAPAGPPMTMNDATEWLLFNWCNADKPPAWKCNGKLGIVPIDAFSEKHEIPLKRLDYVYHNGRFESDDGMGPSIDYELYGFDRKEFSDFMALLGEPLDLLCPMLESQADTESEQNAATPAPILKQLAQGNRILELLKSKGHDPLNLADRKAGKRGAKSEIRTLALSEPALFTKKTFNNAWQSLRDDGRVAGGE